MSAFKKVISLVLCFAMLLGTVAVAGDLLAPKANAAEGTSSVKTYAELAEQYDNFIYLATDAYETVDGELVLSDGYVQPGDLLTFRLYFKSDRYIGSSTLYQVCDFDFFDNTRVTGAEPNSSAGFTEGLDAVSNSAHPMVSGHEMTFSMTSNQGSNVAWLKTVCLIDTAVLATWGTIQIVTNTTPTSTLGTQALRLNQDIWMLEFYLTVREGLEEGATGTIRTEFNVWQMSAHPTTGVAPDKRKRANVYSLPAPASEDAWDSSVDENSCGNMAAQYSSIGAFLYDDLTHTFTIGDAPSGPVATTYTAEFIENDGSTVISSEKYEKGAAVTVPEAVAYQLGWADASTGKLVDLTDYTMPGKKVTFVRVLSTDKFDLKIDLDGGSVDASALPADVTDNGDGTLTAKVPFNGTFDLSTIPAPEKTGYTASWDPSTVTVDSIKGASSKVVWTANTYKVSFYANKGDAEPFTVVDATYGKPLTLTIPADSFDKKLGAWVDYETDEEACAAALKGTNYVAQFGTFTGTSDKSYYASFTEFNSSISFMVRDYESMDINAWKTYTIKYNDAGQKLSVNNITAIVNALKAEGLTVRTLAGQATRYAMYTDSTLSTAIDTTSGIAFDGAKEIYVATVFTVNVTWQVPVFDEATASYTEDLNEATVSQTSLSSGTTPAEIKSVFEVNIKVPSTLKYDAAAGYKFDGWFDEQGNPYTYDSYWGVSLPCGSPENVVLTARFSETQYDVILNMNNGDSPDTLTIEGVKVGLGDSIDLDGATLINTATSEAVEHPVIGAENSEQPVAYRGMNGYKFLGWSVHKAATADDIIEFPIDSISYEALKTSLYKGNIVLYAVWEALEYDLVLMYDTPESNPKGPFEERVFAEPLTFKVKTGDTIETYTKDESIKNLAIENAPEGFKFYDWCQKNGATITDSKMPAYGAKYYANYTSRVIKVYVDYNHGRVDEEGNAIESIQLSALSQSANKDNWLYYGEDFERKADDEAGIKQGAGPEIRNTLVTGNLRPGENYEVVGWDVYHVKNEEDVFDKTKWIKGVNDDGSTIAKDTIVYQIQWKHHSEFLFRVYDTDAKICKALGKNLKMYYWKNGNYATRKEAQVNTQPELLVIFFFKPTLENWDVTRFFDIEMWRSLSLRYDPFSVPKSALTIEAFIAFMKMIPELIGNLIKG